MKYANIVVVSIIIINIKNMKSKTKPFSSEKSANSFAKVVGGKVTEQKTGPSKSVHHVHYKSDGQYKGNKQDVELGSDFDSDLNGNGTRWHTAEDL
jgi:hypothetical protein